MKDLFDAADQRGLSIVKKAEIFALHDVDSNAPYVTWRSDGAAQRLDCDFITGCDGYHGVSRASIPVHMLNIFERVYPFGWLGILVDVRSAEHELVYANHERGFALASMRSPTRSRYYVQCPLDDRIEDWSDAGFWDELCTRLGPATAANIVRGPSTVIPHNFPPAPFAPPQIFKNNVLALYDLMINTKKSEEGTAKFVSPAYIQHNPLIADGSAALGKFFGQITRERARARVVVHRIIAAGDYVWAHVNSLNLFNDDPGDTGIAGVDIYKMDADGRAIEHWDTLQIVGDPKNSAPLIAPNIPRASANGMF